MSTQQATEVAPGPPRLTLGDIEAAIAARLDLTADKALLPGGAIWIGPSVEATKVLEELGTLSICILVMKNGFKVVGKSGPASVANFRAELGKDLAYRDAIDQLWPLMGYALREKLAAG